MELANYTILSARLKFIAVKIPYNATQKQALPAIHCHKIITLVKKKQNAGMLPLPKALLFRIPG